MTHHRSIGAVRVGRNKFKRSYRKLFDCYMGQLIPVQEDIVMPSDIWKMRQEIVIRSQALNTPILHEIDIYTHTYFVPLRILDDKFEEAFTGGENPAQEDILNLTFTKWKEESNTIPYNDIKQYSLWDYFGNPPAEAPGNYEVKPRPNCWFWRAYNKIWNEYYRDQQLQEEIEDLDQGQVLWSAWKKDYFTAARPSPQLGPELALPITGTTFADFSASNFRGDTSQSMVPLPASNYGQILFGGGGSAPPGSLLTGTTNYSGEYISQQLKAGLNQNKVDLSIASTFDWNDLRAVAAMQKWQERNMRAGTRFTEFLQARWGVSPRDDRLQRPEYIGGSKSSLVVSEVLQTSQTTSESPQGTLAGHAIAANITKGIKYRVHEPGIIITLMKIMPKPGYMQGIRREMFMETRFDIPFPEFTRLGEREVKQAEIYYDHNNTSNNYKIFGFNGIFDEFRSAHDMVCGAMRNTHSIWHMTRKFSIAPSLNSEFITMRGDHPNFMKAWAVTDEPPFIVHVGNNIRAIRALPKIAEPGLIDHY